MDTTGSMNTTVKLQEPFSYALWPIILLGIIVGGYLVFLIVSWIRKKVKSKPSVIKQQPQKVIHDLVSIKRKYWNELDGIESELNCGKITVRIAYQRMSTCIRHFVYEVTGIKVHKYTLSEITALNISMLTELIQEYYPSEFDRNTIGDFTTSVEKTKGVIDRWN